MPMTVKLKDIAEAANCSINTVSRALRDCSDIGAKTKRKIKDLAESMGYVPDNIAGYLRNKNTNLVGVVISSTTNPFFTVSLNLLLAQLSDLGYIPLIMVCRNNIVTKDLLMDIISSRVCGIISFSNINDDVKNYCIYGNIPLVLIGVNIGNKEVSAVYPNDYMSGELVGKEFLKSGRTRPCYVAGSKVWVGNKDRRCGFLDAIRESNVACDEYDYDDVDLRNNIITNKNDFIFCYNDEIASFVVEVLERCGYNDYTIFGVDGVWRYLSICRKINSVGGKLDDVIKCGMEMLISKIETGDASPKSKVFPVEIITVD